ncbi:MAG: amino acid ABC transporter substrate-binding protein [Thiogranum sp.]
MRRFIGLLALTALAWHSAMAREIPDTLAKIKNSNTITIAHGTAGRPFSFTKNGEPTGYSIDLCQEIVTSLEKQLGIEDITIKWRAGTTPERLDMVENGAADIDCGTTSITLGRQEKVDFSNPVFVESGGVLVLSKSDIHGLISLTGKKVAVLPGTTTERRLRKALERKHVKAELVEIKDTKEALAALESGRVDAYAGDRLVLIGQVTESKDPSRYSMLTEMFSVDPYGFALPRGDADFRLAVNRALANVYRSAALEQIFVRAFGQDIKPTEVLQAVYLINAYPD